LNHLKTGFTESYKVSGTDRAESQLSLAQICLKIAGSMSSFFSISHLKNCFISMSKLAISQSN